MREQAVRHGDRAILARSLAVLARADVLDSRYVEAMANALEGAGLFRELGDRAGEATCLAHAAGVLSETGPAGSAAEFAEAAVLAARESDDLAALNAAHHAMGRVLYDLGDQPAAIRHHERAGELARLLDSPTQQGAALDSVACCLVMQAERAREAGGRAEADRLLTRAVRLTGQARRIAQQTGHRLYEGTTTANLAEELSALGRHQEALALLDGWVTDPERDPSHLVTHHLTCRGEVYRALGRLDEALAQFRQALEIGGSRWTESYALGRLADLYEQTGDYYAALQHHKEYLRAQQEMSYDRARQAAGVAEVLWETRRARQEAEQARALAETLAESNAELLRRESTLHRQALEDPLTGLANRRAWDLALEGLERNGAVAMVDVDHFKEINDTWSHPVGDRVLAVLAELLRGTCRASDLTARYGGEEFALYFGSTPPDRVLDTIEQLREQVRGYDWDQVQPGLRVTVSAGVAYQREHATMAEVFALADRRLYQAKAAGRDRVVGPPEADVIDLAEVEARQARPVAAGPASGQDVPHDDDR